MSENNKEKHQSYATLQFNHSSGSPKALFGSSIEHSHTIRMYIREGSVERDLNHDFYMGDGLILEAEMSYSQFAEAITSMNMGSGVPVTLRWLRGTGDIPACPFIDKRQQFESELTEHLSETNADVNALIDDVRKIFDDKKSINKSDRTAILEKLNMLSTAINKNSTYIYKQFNEQMNKTVTEAKGEIEAFAQNKLNSIAMQALAEQNAAISASDIPVALIESENNK